ncbi:MAG: MBL fold metallo-hydrolase [Acidimicrobiales bacterium]
MSRPRKQEQEPASDEVTEVAPNVLRMQLPIQMPGLGHVNTYALIDSTGVAIVDPGLPGPLSWKALQDRLKKAEVAVRNIHSVIITHSHPDHYGGAARLAKDADASVVAHAAFRNWWHGHTTGDPCDVADLEPDDLLPPREDGSPPDMMTPWGGKSFRPPMKRRLMFRLMRSRMSHRFGPPPVTSPLRHGEMIKLAGREFFAVHTPGHTLDHLCLHDPEAGLLLSGDHVLPTITPHISGMNAGRDPLSLFFDSLDRVAALDDVTKVLPAHGHPFDDLAARANGIKDHHHERLQKLHDVAADIGRGTVEDFSHHLFRKERWGSMAESETYAHLEHLRFLGQAERHDPGDGMLVYELDHAGAPA